jgi:hypothetical protein
MLTDEKKRKRITDIYDKSKSRPTGFYRNNKLIKASTAQFNENPNSCGLFYEQTKAAKWTATKSGCNKQTICR